MREIYHSIVVVYLLRFLHRVKVVDNNLRVKTVSSFCNALPRCYFTQCLAKIYLVIKTLIDINPQAFFNK
jgi:hypothetical protein